MPRKLEYRQVIARVKAERPHIEIKARRGKGSHRMLFDPTIPAHFPLPHHGNDKRLIMPGMLKDLIRHLDLPDDIFD
jgi:predicted RNA binding protein YcfA (HicA-like mRNA interferase family)